MEWCLSCINPLIYLCLEITSTMKTCNTWRLRCICMLYSKKRKYNKIIIWYILITKLQWESSTTLYIGWPMCRVEIVDWWSTKIPPAQLQKLKWPVWPWALTYWPRNNVRHIIPSWVVFLPHMDIIHEIGNEPLSGYGVQNGRTDVLTDRGSETNKPPHPHYAGV